MTLCYTCKVEKPDAEFIRKGTFTDTELKNCANCRAEYVSARCMFCMGEREQTNKLHRLKTCEYTHIDCMKREGPKHFKDGYFTSPNKPLKMKVVNDLRFNNWGEPEAV